MANGYGYVGINETLRGMSLSNWLGEWVQWLHGSSVDYNSKPGEILHTRGGLSYTGLAGGPRKQLDTKNAQEVFITTQVPVYVNVLTSFYFLGESHPSGSLDTFNEVISACRDDFQRSHVLAAEINDAGLQYVYVEAYDFAVKVHPNSFLADQFEMPVARGAELRGCAVGYISLIRSLPIGEYHIKTHNQGVRQYESESDYTIHVRNDDGSNFFTDTEFIIKNKTQINDQEKGLNNIPAMTLIKKA